MAIRQLVLGAGLYLGLLLAVEKELASGEMVALLPDSTCVSYPIHVLWLPTDYLPAKVRVFAEGFALFVANEGALEH